MQELGRIVKLQVQRSGLKNPAAPPARHPRVFDPAPLLEVPELSLTPDGVLGLPGDVIDVHNRLHPETRNIGKNPVSVGFTAHYALMRGRFGEHLPDGVAGENVLVESAASVDPTRLTGGIGIRTRDGQLVKLEQVIVAEPCVEFTRFALRLTPNEPTNDDVTDGLRFLREGVRGFYATYAGDAVVLRPGDAVFSLD